jgi:hypothetical protein
VHAAQSDSRQRTSDFTASTVDRCRIHHTPGTRIQPRRQRRNDTARCDALASTIDRCRIHHTPRTRIQPRRQRRNDIARCDALASTVDRCRIHHTPGTRIQPRRQRREPPPVGGGGVSFAPAVVRGGAARWWAALIHARCRWDRVALSPSASRHAGGPGFPASVPRPPLLTGASGKTAPAAGVARALAPPSSGPRPVLALFRGGLGLRLGHRVGHGGRGGGPSQRLSGILPVSNPGIHAGEFRRGHRDR